ncbi:hypothetical protein TIFTF001_020147 [Ficus carica]|uniref:Uncharacterized protein n=1 Tax=Ficus carica TaxID=3494 RepID=A0AA88AD26_FICCA|nr:hypothetical protein TIFTF001_020147 [Ficus carica]
MSPRDSCCPCHRHFESQSEKRPRSKAVVQRGAYRIYMEACHGSLLGSFSSTTDIRILTVANPANETERELHQQVGLLKEVLEGFDNNFLEIIQGQEGFTTMSEPLSQIEAMFSVDWNGLFNDVDFGWGKPFWKGVMGKAGPAFRNLVVFIDSQWGKGIQAWITLEEKQMKVLESDKEFLEFASGFQDCVSLG